MEAKSHKHTENQKKKKTMVKYISRYMNQE